MKHIALQYKLFKYFVKKKTGKKKKKTIAKGNYMLFYNHGTLFRNLRAIQGDSLMKSAWCH